MIQKREKECDDCKTKICSKRGKLMNKCRLMFLRSDSSRNLRNLVAQESPYNSTDTLLLAATFLLSRNIGKKEVETGM
jgi:hypothetical protein